MTIAMLQLIRWIQSSTTTTSSRLSNKHPPSPVFFLCPHLFSALYSSLFVLCPIRGRHMSAPVYIWINNGMYTPARRPWMPLSFQKSLPPSAMPLYSSCHYGLLFVLPDIARLLFFFTWALRPYFQQNMFALTLCCARQRQNRRSGLQCIIVILS